MFQHYLVSPIKTNYIRNQSHTDSHINEYTSNKNPSGIKPSLNKHHYQTLSLKASFRCIRKGALNPPLLPSYCSILRHSAIPGGRKQQHSPSADSNEWSGGEQSGVQSVSRCSLIGSQSACVAVTRA